MKSFVVNFKFMVTDYKVFESSFAVTPTEEQLNDLGNLFMDELNKNVPKRDDILCSYISNIYELG